MYNIGEHCNYNNPYLTCSTKSTTWYQKQAIYLKYSHGMSYGILCRYQCNLRQTKVWMCLSTLLVLVCFNLILYQRFVVLRTLYGEILLQLFYWGIWCQCDTRIGNDMFYGMIFWLSNVFTNLNEWVII
jgi:hypothetical protein